MISWDSFNQSLFDNIMELSIDAGEKIKQLESQMDAGRILIVRDLQEAAKLRNGLPNNAREFVLVCKDSGFWFDGSLVPEI